MAVSYRKHEILSGAFIISALAVFALFAFKVGGFDLGGVLAPGVLECRTYMPDVKTLEVDAKVVVGGRRVGTVTGIDLVGARDLAALADPGKPVRNLVLVTFEIEDGGLSINAEAEDLKVALVQDGFLGTHHLSLDPGSWPAGTVPVPVSEASIREPLVVEADTEGGLDTLVSEAVPLVETARGLVEELQRTARTINRTLVTEDPDKGVQAVLGTVEETAGEARALLRRLADLLAYEHPEGLHQLLVLPLNNLIDNLDGGVTSVRGSLEGKLLERMEGILEEGTRASAEARRAAAAARRAVDKAAPRVNRILSDLEETTGKLEGHITAVRGDLTRLMENANGIVTDNRAELREILRRLRRSMWEVEMFSRKVRANPAVVIWGDDEPDLSPAEVDETFLRERGRMPPYLQRDER